MAYKSQAGIYVQVKTVGFALCYWKKATRSNTARFQTPLLFARKSSKSFTINAGIEKQARFIFLEIWSMLSRRDMTVFLAKLKKAIVGTQRWVEVAISK